MHLGSRDDNKLHHHKFHPSDNPLNNDRLSLTPQCIKKNEEAFKKEKGIIMFDPPICTTNDLETCFRVFTDLGMKCYLPVTRPNIQENPPPLTPDNNLF